MTFNTCSGRLPTTFLVDGVADQVEEVDEQECTLERLFVNADIGREFCTELSYRLCLQVRRNARILYCNLVVRI